MKKSDKGKLFLALMIVLFALLLTMNLSSAKLMNATLISPKTVEVNTYNLFNLSVNDTNLPTNINFTQVNVTLPTAIISGFDPAVNTSAYPRANLSGSYGQRVTVTWTNNTQGYHLIPNGTKAYFWFNMSVNKTGKFNITVISLDTKGNTNITNLTITVQDTKKPAIVFSSPTPSNNSNVSTPYFTIKVSATDYNLSAISIFLYNSSKLVNSTINKTIYKSSSSLSFNFTGLSNGTYYVNATANDTSNNFNVTLLRYININTSLSQTQQCVANWTCGNWSTCSNVTKTQQRTCTDSNQCSGATSPITNKSCTPTVVNSSCSTNWNCTWVPACTSNNQTQYYSCTDLNGCKPPYNETQRQCSVTTSTQDTGSKTAGKLGLNTGSWTFFLVIAVIAIAVVGVIVVLMRIKKNPSEESDVYTPNPSPSSSGIPPRKGPPGNMPPGSTMPRRMMPRRNPQQRPQQQRRMSPQGNQGNFNRFQTY